MPEESLGQPAQADQTQACAQTCAHTQLSQERTALHLFPLLHGVWNTRALKLFKSCWHLVGMLCLPYTSSSLFLCHLPPPECCQVPLKKRAECLPKSLCARIEASLWICSQSCSLDLLINLGIWPFKLWSQRQLDFQSTISLDFTGCLGHLGLGRTWVSLQKCNIRG